MIILVGLLVVAMFFGAVGVVFKSGEKEGICKYGYLEEKEDGEK